MTRPSTVQFIIEALSHESEGTARSISSWIAETRGPRFAPLPGEIGSVLRSLRIEGVVVARSPATSTRVLSYSLAPRPKSPRTGSIQARSLGGGCVPDRSLPSRSDDA
jgi:hypothetical protein